MVLNHNIMVKNETINLLKILIANNSQDFTINALSKNSNNMKKSLRGDIKKISSIQ